MKDNNGQSKDISQDIKGQRESHISTPVNSDAEFHLRKTEIGNIQPKLKGLYWVCFPVVCVSDNEKGKTVAGEDVEMCRFMQWGVAKVIEDKDHPQEDKGSSNKKLERKLKDVGNDMSRRTK